MKAIWDEAERQLHNNPGLEAQELFEELLRKWPGAADLGHCGHSGAGWPIGVGGTVRTSKCSSPGSPAR